MSLLLDQIKSLRNDPAGAAPKALQRPHAFVTVLSLAVFVVVLALRDVATISGSTLVMRLAVALVMIVASGAILFMVDAESRPLMVKTALACLEALVLGLVFTGVRPGEPLESFAIFTLFGLLVGLASTSILWAVSAEIALGVALFSALGPLLVERWYLTVLALSSLPIAAFAALRLRAALVEIFEARQKLNSVAAEALAIASENAKTALVDQVTALPNRRAFVAEVTRRLRGRANVQLIVGILDIDAFRSVNERFGRQGGDQLLSEIGRRLKSIDVVPMTVARIGADEFGLLIQRGLSDQVLEQFARALALSLAQPFRQNATPTGGLTAAIGFARSRPGDSSDTLLDRSDFAAFEARQRGPGELVIFSEELEGRMARERVLENELLDANLEEQIRQVYQPIYDIEQRALIGYEALVRWNSPTLGDVSPADFVPVAERLGLVPRITGIVTAAALALSADLPMGERISINLSPRDLNSAEGMRRLLTLLETSNFRPLRVDFEITETAVMGDLDEARGLLLRLKALGANISLDDFGTGQSSLSRVQLLPLDRIKIDRTFVVDIETNPASLSIVQTIIDLCRNLGVTCIVEGVETERQVEILRELGVRYFQGFLFGYPRSASAIREDMAAADAAALEAQAQSA
jgi:diguanylate cyclase (GGDEF)-like protein